MVYGGAPQNNLSFLYSSEGRCGSGSLLPSGSGSRAHRRTHRICITIFPYGHREAAKKLFIRLWALGTKTSHNSGLGGGSNKKNTSDPYHGHGSIKFILNITVSKKVISV